MMIVRSHAAALRCAGMLSTSQSIAPLLCRPTSERSSASAPWGRIRHSTNVGAGPKAGPDLDSEEASSKLEVALTRQDEAEQELKLQEEAERELRRLESLPVKETKTEILAFWVASACAFGAWIWYSEGPVKAQEFFAGYLLEQSLSVDNLFVFVLVFSYFKTPIEAQGKVLSYGIGTAAVLRLVLILLGTELVQQFEPVLVLFSGILLFSSYKLLTAQGDDDEDLADNAIVMFCKKFISSTDVYDGNNFFTTLADGARVATPLLLTLAVIEVGDVVFAVDSIPAVFGITLDPFIVYTSNIFAILSLRALYAFVSTVMTDLRFLDKAVALVLGFIGVKMLAGFADVVVPTDVSLLVVGVLLGGGVAASLLLPEPGKQE